VVGVRSLPVLDSALIKRFLDFFLVQRQHTRDREDVAKESVKAFFKTNSKTSQQQTKTALISIM
jgi:hypothetical protein